jgi:hypothetical protein
MAKWDVSKLEREAQNHIGGKRKQFSEGMRDYIAPLEQYVLDNLYDSQEREHVLLSLQTAILFAESAAKRYGIK